MNSQVNHQKIVTVSYVEAHYSYVSDLSLPQGEVVSSGRIIEETSKFIDLEIAWQESPHKTIFGIVIPKKAITQFDIDISKINRDEYRLNDKVAVYWTDIFAYNEDYDGEHLPSQMLTEGTLIQEKDGFLLLDDPETLNMTKIENHPEKKPKRYCIPICLASEIMKIEKHE